MLQYIYGVITLAAIWSLLALALNLQWGFASLLNFGVVAWFASGAYAMAWVTNPAPTEFSYHVFSFGLNPIFGLIAAGVIGLVLGLLISLLTYRVAGHQLGLATFAVAAILVEGLYRNEQWLTGGEFGILNLPVPFDSLSPDSQSILLMVISIVILLGFIWGLRRILDSPFGRILQSTKVGYDRDFNPLGIESLGKSASKYKVLAFGLGGLVAGIAGGLYAWYNGGIVTLSMFPNIITFEVWVAMLMGGAGSILGMVLGGSILTVLLYGFKLLPLKAIGGAVFAGNFSFVLMGLIIILVIRFRPEGIMGERIE